MSLQPPTMPVTSEATVDEPLPEVSDEQQPRMFPCEGCGADLKWHIGHQKLQCPYCGHTKTIEFAPDDEIVEQDFHSMLDKLTQMRSSERAATQSLREIECGSCKGITQFFGTLTSRECAYCGVPLVLDRVHDSPVRIPVDGILPFLVEHDQARTHLKAWVLSRWFAPNDFKERGIQGRFNGVYLPYWTFDSMTFTRYTGQRGEHYWVTVGSGKNRRRERRTRWYPASGHFQRFFDDVLVIAGLGLPVRRLMDLEPWPLNRCVPFHPELLSGFLARTYDVELEPGFVSARGRIDDALRRDVKQRIGGDEQRIHSIDTRYDAITFKHLLLPVWMLTYRYGEKSYQVTVNAATGEVQGDRPYSWIKISLAVLVGLAAALAIAWFATQR